MSEHQTLIAQHASWWPDNIENKSRLPDYLSSWLLDKGSLTSALTQLCDGDFKVELKWQGIAKAYPHEQEKLNLRQDQQSLIREVELNIYDEPVVFARSIIPLGLTGSGEGSLENLGTKPLGHLLFKDGDIRVSKREFAEIDNDGVSIFARRTPYDYEGQQILVSEFFLPSFDRFVTK